MSEFRIRPDDPFAYAISADHAHLAYRVIVKGGMTSLWLDGQLGPPFDDVQGGRMPDNPVCMFSADGRRSAYVGLRGGKAHVVVAGKVGEPFDAVEQVEFSPDGAHLAFVAKLGVKTHVVLDGEAGPAYDWANLITFSPEGKMGHLANVGSRWVTVVDGKEAASLDLGSDDVVSFNLSPDLKRTAWIRRMTDGLVCYVDGQAGPKFQAIERPVFSADASRVVYRANRQPRELGKWRNVVVDGVPGEDFSEVGELVVSASGNHTAFFAMWAAADGSAVRGTVVDGVKGTGRFGLIAGTLTFSRDGKRLAYGVSAPAIGRSGAETLVVLDGKEGPRFAAVLGLRFSPDGAHLAYAAKPWRDGVPVAARVILDGVALPESADPAAIEFTPDGARLVWVAVRGKVHALGTARIGAPSGEKPLSAVLNLDHILTRGLHFTSDREGRMIGLRKGIVTPDAIYCSFEIERR